ncbi:protein containing Rieske [2Fe-2S] domain [Bacteroidales bacterium 6E]|nr:protein containing Rieske [2Fe-2S] domain [Bacteroidales bacterium 6E]
MRRIFRVIAVWFLMSLMFWACDKDNYRVIPYVDVYLTVNLNIVNELMVPGNSVAFGGQGYGGIIIYCVEAGNLYYAYDGACTHEISSTCRVKNEGVLATCPCCGSQFILMGEAYPSKGPATFPLQQYNTSVAGNMLRIYN